MFDLHGKTALVIGGTGDLGKGMLEALAEAGAKCVVVGREDRPAKVAKEMTDKGLCVLPLCADLSVRENIQPAYDKALAMLDGRLDILVNAAGIQRRHKCEAFPIEDWDDVLELNLTMMFQFCQLAGRTMLEQGYGKIINVASMLSFFGGFTVPAYAASKGGVAQLTKALANEWASQGININAVAPGYMATKMNTALINDPGRSHEILSRIPQGRWGTDKDMKGVTVFLASSASDYVNGAVIPIDGGYLGR